MRGEGGEGEEEEEDGGTGEGEFVLNLSFSCIQKDFVTKLHLKRKFKKVKKMKVK
jgi:hypothetical protein